MIKSFPVLLVVLLCAMALLLFTCTSTNNKPLLIDFSADSTSIVFSNIDQPGLLQLKNTLNSDSALRELISVLQTPSERDTAIREELIEGQVHIENNGIVFVPARPFTKGNDYLVITYLNARFGNAEDIAKGGLGYGVKPLQKLLTR